MNFRILAFITLVSAVAASPIVSRFKPQNVYLLIHLCVAVGEAGIRRNCDRHRQCDPSDRR